MIRMQRDEKMIPYLFLFPYLFFFVIFFIYPIGFSFWLSFHKFRGYGEPVFVGLKNFYRLFSYSKFWVTVGNTFFYVIAHWLPTIVISFSLALAVHESAKAVQRIAKPLIFLPQVIATVSSAMIFRIIFAKNSGVINNLLGTQIGFLSDPDWMRWSVVIMMVWRAVGWFFVIFLAGLTLVSKDVEEAAKIDGAGFFCRTFRITIPIMKNIFMFTFIMEAKSTLMVFVEPNILISGGMSAPLRVKPIASILVDNVRNGYFGQASAAGWLLFLLVFLVTIIQFTLFRGKSDRGSNK